MSAAILPLVIAAQAAARCDAAAWEIGEHVLLGACLGLGAVLVLDWWTKRGRR